MYRLTMRDEQGNVILSLIGSKTALQNKAEYLRRYNKCAKVNYRVRVTEVKRKEVIK